MSSCKPTAGNTSAAKENKEMNNNGTRLRRLRDGNNSGIMSSNIRMLNPNTTRRPRPPAASNYSLLNLSIPRPPVVSNNGIISSNSRSNSVPRNSKNNKSSGSFKRLPNLQFILNSKPVPNNVMT
jgi:hypothetical protein